jgi:hypothetical protein
LQHRGTGGGGGKVPQFRADVALVLSHRFYLKTNAANEKEIVAIPIVICPEPIAT